MNDLEMHSWELGPGMEPPPCVVDIRTEDQFARGHLPGAMHLSYNQFQAEALQVLSEYAWVVVVDAAGARAAEMAVWVRARGINARYLVGGMAGWRGTLERP